MRIAIIVLVAMAGCGGEGKCERPPCRVPAIPCMSNADCFQTELCDFQNDSCGRDPDDMGSCVQRPSGICDRSLQLTCGCDGKFHDNTCVAAVEGADRSQAGGCAPPAGFFACGDTACDSLTQMCTDFDSGGSHFFVCEPLPSQCTSNPTCACVARIGCDDCRETPGVTQTCMLSPDPAGGE
jgi:hypothetical protein